MRRQMKSKSLGDRMKEYEGVTRNFLTRRTPVIVRVDGRAFHTLTRNFNKPFDQGFMTVMIKSAVVLFKEMQGCKLAYVQSDEASFLLTDWDDLSTEPWFGNNLNKIVSVSAAVMSVTFSNWLDTYSSRGCNTVFSIFDSRAFQLPRDEITNYFLWRAKDWERNSLQMYCQAHFSHKQLHKKGHAEMHEMLHSIGKNWTTDLTYQEKNGTWITDASDRDKLEMLKNPDTNTDYCRCDSITQPNYADINKLVKSVLPKEDTP